MRHASPYIWHHSWESVEHRWQKCGAGSVAQPWITITFVRNSDGWCCFPFQLEFQVSLLVACVAVYLTSFLGILGTQVAEMWSEWRCSAMDYHEHCQKQRWMMLFTLSTFDVRFGVKFGVMWRRIETHTQLSSLLDADMVSSQSDVNHYNVRTYVTQLSV